MDKDELKKALWRVQADRLYIKKLGDTYDQGVLMASLPFLSALKDYKNELFQRLGELVYTTERDLQDDD